MADFRVERQEQEKGEWEGQEHDLKRQRLDLQSPIVEEEEEEEFEEGFSDIGEDCFNFSALKEKYKADPEVDEKAKEQLDQHLDQVQKSLGFDIDVGIRLHRYYSWAYPVRLQDPEFQKDVDKIYKSIKAALEEYKERKGRELELVELVKANMVNTWHSHGELYFITFEAKNKHGKVKTYQTRVNYLDCNMEEDTDDEDDEDIEYIDTGIDYEGSELVTDRTLITVEIFRQKPSP